MKNPNLASTKQKWETLNEDLQPTVSQETELEH